jgi:hypothetical protein
VDFIKRSGGIDYFTSSIVSGAVADESSGAGLHRMKPDSAGVD